MLGPKGGLIQRLEHSNAYVLTDDGLRLAVFYERHVEDYAGEAHIAV